MILSIFPLILIANIFLCLIISILTDIRNRIIPNRLVAIILLCSIGLRLEFGYGPLLASILSAGAVLAALSLLASNDLLGWGDAKLIAAVSIAVPAGRVISLLFAITLAGGMLSCAYLAARFALRHSAHLPFSTEPETGRRWVLWRLIRREGARILANEPMPYALAVFGGFAYGLASE
jgi:prepilin peptidase CpaA